MSQHTKGFWNVETWHKILPNGNCGDKVVQVSTFDVTGNRSLAIQITGGCNEDEVEANARLIAAAPELLQALELMRSEFGDDSLKFADIAIRKAKGLE